MRFTVGLTLFLGLSLGACNKAPEACIEVDKSSASTGSPIQFTSCSKHALSYIWSFDGPEGAIENDTMRSEETFSMSFSTAGTYTVHLDAYKRYSWLGESSSATTTVTIN
jgi:PKD repeat protein